MNPTPKKKKPSGTQSRVRQNISFSKETLDMLRAEAKRQDTTMSALLTRWIREKAEAPKP